MINLKRKISLFIFLIMILVSILGYYLYKNNNLQINNQSESQQINKNTDINNQALNGYTEEIIPIEPKNIPEKNNIFGLNLFKLLFSKTESDENIFISPNSIAMALSMVYNGAREETKNQISQVLNFTDLNEDTVKKEYLGLIRSLNDTDDIKLNVANSIWVRDGFNFNQNFSQILKDYFQAEIASLNFEDKSAADIINNWVKNKTQNKITQIINPPINSDVVMYLINAIYFKGNWSEEFDKKMTYQDTFNNYNNTSSEQDFMVKDDRLFYGSGTDYQGVFLEYGEDNRFGMYVFLPNDMEKFISEMDYSKLQNIMGSLLPQKGTVILPKFKSEYKKELKEVLSDLGMPIAFSDNADLSGIANNLKISSVLHKSFIEVNEEGTEAAAATSVEISLTSIQPEEGFTMKVDKPFFYLIRDLETDTVLFMGVIKTLE